MQTTIKKTESQIDAAKEIHFKKFRQTHPEVKDTAKKYLQVNHETRDMEILAIATIVAINDAAGKANYN